MTAATDRLVKLARQHRDGAPPADDILSAPVLLSVLRALLEKHLQDTEPEPIPEHIERYASGDVTIPEQPAPERAALEDFTQTARELATLISYIEELPPAKVRAA